MKCWFNAYVGGIVIKQQALQVKRLQQAQLASAMTVRCTNNRARRDDFVSLNFLRTTRFPLACLRSDGRQAPILCLMFTFDYLPHAQKQIIQHIAINTRCYSVLGSRTGRRLPSIRPLHWERQSTRTAACTKRRRQECNDNATITENAQHQSVATSQKHYHQYSIDCPLIYCWCCGNENGCICVSEAACVWKLSPASVCGGCLIKNVNVYLQILMLIGGIISSFMSVLQVLILSNNQD